MPETEKQVVVNRLRQSDSSVAEIFSEHREKLAKMIRYRLDPRLVGRIDADDLIQEVWFDVQRRLNEYVAAPNVPFLLWLRQLTAQVISKTHRVHLKTQKRDVRREFPLASDPQQFSGSVSIARHLVAAISTPSRVVAREEMIEILVQTLNELEKIDREIILLRHFEELSNAEAAMELGIEPFTASKRYVRAMKRLTTSMSSFQSEGPAHD